MPTQPKTAISGQLNAAQLVIANPVGNKAIARLVATRGYNADMLAGYGYKAETLRSERNSIAAFQQALAALRR